MLKEWMPKRIRIQLLIILAVQFSAYWGAKFMTRNSVHYNMTLPFDNSIPLLKWTVLIYFGCFLFWAVNYTVILRTEPEGTYRFLQAEIFGKLICFITYIAIPTIIVRPEIIGNDVFSDLMRLLYLEDTPEALFPSMHCYVSWMCVIGLRGKPEISNRYRVFSIIVAMMVFVATLTTKQHVFVDVVAGVLLAEFVYFVAGLGLCNNRTDCKSASLRL